MTKRIALALAFCCALHAGTYYVSNKNGNWSDTTMWTPNGTPGTTDSVRISHTVTVDVNTTIGNKLTAVATYGFTCSMTISGTINLNGAAGSTFLSDLHVGDVYTCGNKIRTVASITSDTVATTRDQQGTTQGAGSTLTYRHPAIAIDPSKSLTVSSGVSLTLQGDVNNAGGTFTAAAGSAVTFDASYGLVYVMFTGHDNFGGSTYNFNGTSGSHVTVVTAGGSTYGQMLATNTLDAPNFTATFTDFSDLGNEANDANAIGCGTTWKMENSTLTRVGRIVVGPNPGGTSTAGGSAIGNACNVSFKNNVVSAPLIGSGGGSDTYHNVAAINPATNFYTVIRFVDAGSGTITGTRNIKDNILCYPSVVGTNLEFGNGSIKAYTVTGNCFNHALENNSGGQTNNAGQLFSGNLFLFKFLSNFNSTNWNFLGNGGDTIQKNYFVNDMGPNQQNDPALMQDDTPSAGTWRYTDSVMEITGPPTGGFHCSHPGSSGTGNPAVTWVIDHFLTIPNGLGQGPCAFALRGTSTVTAQLYNNTLMGTGYFDTTSGGLIAGCCGTSGWAGYITLIKNNLFWQKSVGSTNTDGYGAHYVSTVPDTIASGVIDYNAHYNPRTGHLLDSGGTNAATTVGYDGFRVTTTAGFNIGSHDINLGTGANEATAGAFFVDPTRNLATFDRAYLAHTSTDADGHSINAWADTTVYAVGDTVSAATSGWYGNVTINYRCIKAHTAAAANATNGKPGNYTTVTAWRTNWEFASSYSIRKGMGEAVNGVASSITDSSLGLTSANYIDTLRTWVQRGFRVRIGSLRNAGYDGTDIGCCGVQLPKMAVTNR